MSETPEWRPTACILCSCNCGIEVQLGGEDQRHFARIRGDRRHPESRGYVCQKAGRLDHYQNSRDRLLAPQRRRPDGSYETVDWQTAIREVAARLAAVRDQHGGSTIFYYGGGGQGNHLPAGYASSTRAALGSVYRSNAIAQEKTGEMWVHKEMMHTAAAHGDFEHCEVGVFLGKNPWQSHGIPRARVTLREISKDPERALVVIDTTRTETADLADYFLQVRPGTDAWLLSAMLGTLVQEDLLDRAWLAEHTDGLDEIEPLLRALDVGRSCQVCGVDEALVRETTRRIASATSVSVFEDLGVQMNRHSTLVSYLQRLLWLLTGNFGKAGAHNPATSLVPIATGSRSGPHRTPVAQAPIIVGLTPCNLIPSEILTDHPQRYRAMIVESANPLHSLADSPTWREAMKALEFSVVIDVAMTETARCADYVLPATTQYEKAEATFFAAGFPENFFHLRAPLLEPVPGPLPEPEIHARLVEELGALPAAPIDRLRAALAEGGRSGFARAFAEETGAEPALKRVASVLLYRTLGESLPAGLESAAALWRACHLCARIYPESIRRAGIEGIGPQLGESLFDAILAAPSGLVFSVDPPEEAWQRLRPDERLHLFLPDLADELETLRDEDPRWTSDEFPFVLSAGERRAFTANTVYRDPHWRRKDFAGALRMSPRDAATLQVADGDRVRIATRRGTAEAVVETNDRMQPGHVSLPNGLGLDYPDDAGKRQVQGLPPNELTSIEDHDRFVGTPWHKTVPARIEALPVEPS
jgi:formate dehydrogenase